ncbi:Glycosyl transferase family 2 [Amantichitinum ursilacus]|uniref:Glycosyl transferase family 2 n=1 Tax=Amantichitinum ursilacus TaxID=857265 RepID=A0A0N0XKC5_9NEIS|nr:Glycosyl transferase family 2 [Amantichitinum ursilacus]
MLGASQNPVAGPALLTFVTTCKGRLSHLQLTLPTWLAQRDCAVIVVDYGCPDGAGDWVAAHHPQVAVVRVNDDASFCLARARNAALPHIRTDWVCFIDADIRVTGDLAGWFAEQPNPAGFYRPDPFDFDTGGTVLCRVQDVQRAGGYDELIRGYGGEDTDLYARLLRIGVPRRAFNGAWLAPIRHDTEARLRFYQDKDLEQHRRLFLLYRTIKLDLIDLHKRMLSADELRTIFGLAQQALAANAPLSIKLGEQPEFPAFGGFSLQRSLVYNLTARQTP